MELFEWKKDREMLVAFPDLFFIFYSFPGGFFLYSYRVINKLFVIFYCI